MSYVTDFLTNPIFLAPALSWVAAQLVKLIIQLVKRAPLNRLLTGGGMPSSHTATVFGLLIETAIRYGTGGFEFPMALFFAIMIIYDALNVRYVTGEQSKVINKVVSEHASDEDPFWHSRPKYPELLGHTLPEVIAGAVVGTVVAILVGVIAA